MPCVKTVCIWSCSGSHFPAFGLNRERCGVSLRIQSEWGKMRTRITPNMGTFNAVMEIQINDQGREFVNEVSKVLCNMIGIEQRTTSAHNPQSNRLCERKNSIIRDSLVKVLAWNGNVCDWPNIVKGVLFAQRVREYASTKFSPYFQIFFLMGAYFTNRFQV